jgi:hypothetical protein
LKGRVVVSAPFPGLVIDSQLLAAQVSGRAIVIGRLLAGLAIDPQPLVGR